MKLGRNDHWTMPDDCIRPLFGFGAKGLSYLVRKAKKWAFLAFSRCSMAVRGQIGDQVPSEAVEGIVGSGWDHA